MLFRSGQDSGSPSPRAWATVWSCPSMYEHFLASVLYELQCPPAPSNMGGEKNKFPWHCSFGKPSLPLLPLTMLSRGAIFPENKVSKLPHWHQTKPKFSSIASSAWRGWEKQEHSGSREARPAGFSGWGAWERGALCPGSSSS